MIFRYICFVLLTAIVSINLQAEYKLVDKNCAKVGAEPIVLYSEVIKKASAESLSPKEAMASLMHDRALRIYAQQSKFTSVDDHRLAEQYIADIMKKKNLTREQLAFELKHPPYSTTISQFEYDMTLKIIRNRFESSMVNNIDITEQDIELKRKNLANSTKTYEVYFISVMHVQGISRTAQFSKAKLIKEDLVTIPLLDKVKEKYQNDSGVVFVGPVEYQKGALKEPYESQAEKMGSVKLSEPFEDGRAVTVIMKLPKESSDSHKTTLENEQKERYKKDIEKEVIEQRLHAATTDVLASVPVEVSCTW